jgi:hypothetical protein
MSITCGGPTPTMGTTVDMTGQLTGSLSNQHAMAMATTNMPSLRNLKDADIVLVKSLLLYQLS